MQAMQKGHKCKYEPAVIEVLRGFLGLSSTTLAAQNLASQRAVLGNLPCIGKQPRRWPGRLRAVPCQRVRQGRMPWARLTDLRLCRLGVPAVPSHVL